MVVRSEKKKKSDVIVAPKFSDEALCLYSTFQKIFVENPSSELVFDEKLLGYDHLSRVKMVGSITAKWNKATNLSPNPIFAIYGTRTNPTPIVNLPKLREKSQNMAPLEVEIENVYFSEGTTTELKTSLLQFFK